MVQLFFWLLLLDLLELDSGAHVVCLLYPFFQFEITSYFQLLKIRNPKAKVKSQFIKYLFRFTGHLFSTSENCCINRALITVKES